MNTLNRDNSYLIGNQFAKGSPPNKTAFKKGQPAWNKGKTRTWESPTEFKKGQPGNNHLPIGTITVRRDRSGTLRNWIKIAETKKWIEYAKHLWLEAGNTIPPGYCLHHKNNNSLDDRIENLMTVSRREHPTLHNRWNTQNKPAVKRLKSLPGVQKKMTLDIPPVKKPLTVTFDRPIEIDPFSTWIRDDGSPFHVGE